MKKGAIIQNTSPRAPGFTLIEVLVTVTIASLALTVLVGGLRAGARAYRATVKHQQHRAGDEAALARLREDLRHICVVAEGVPPLMEESSGSGSGSETLRITGVGSTARLRGGVGGVWHRVEYRVGEDREGISGLLRLESRYVADETAVGPPPVPELLLAGVTSASFSYADRGTLRDSWNDDEQAPAAVSVMLERDAGQALTETVWIPAAMQGEAP